MGGKVRIGHVCNEPIALKLVDAIRAEHPAVDIEYYPSAALCSFYAEKGGFLLGFEKA